MKVGNIECYGIIYLITNKINNKHYVGQTINKRGFKGRYNHRGESNIEKVYNYHSYYKKVNKPYNEYLLNSITKYGFDNFEVNEIFDVAFSEEELNIKEKCWIKVYMSDSFKLGYNKNEGGKNARLSDMTKSNLSKSMIESNHYIAKPIVQLDLKGNVIKIWDNGANEIKRCLKVDTKAIRGCCQKKPKRYTYKNFIWLYEEDYKINGLDLQYHLNNKRVREVLQYNLDGTFIKEWAMLIEASEELNINRCAISFCCNKKTKSSGGFIWKWKH